MVARWIRSFREMLGRRHTVRAHFWQTLAVYVQQGFGLFLGVVLARLLTPADFGRFAFAAATISLAVLPIAWGLGQILVTDAGRTPSLFSEVAAFAWVVCGARTLVVLGVSAVLAVTISPQTASLALAFGLIESLREFNTVRVADLQGRGQFKPNFLAEAGSACITAAVVFPFARWIGGPQTLLLPGLCSLAVGFFIFRAANPKALTAPRSLRGLDRHLAPGFWLWLIGLAQTAFARVDVWFLGRSCDPASLGNYARACNYAPMSHWILNSLMTNASVSALAQAPSPAMRRKILSKIGFMLIAGGIVNWAALAFAAGPIVLFVFGPQWHDAIPSFRAFAPMSLCWAVFYIPLLALLARGRYAVLACIRLAGVLGLVLWLGTHATHLTPVAVAIAVQITLIAQAACLTLACIVRSAKPQTYSVG
jgi:PST family polysaccharide transporter